MEKQKKASRDRERHFRKEKCKEKIPADDREEVLTIALVKYDETYAPIALGQEKLFSDKREDTPRKKRMELYLRGQKVELLEQEFYALRFAIGQYRAKKHSRYVPPNPPTTLDGLPHR
ncbi:MAG TPA: hypothetical protein DCX25_00605 [Candidatus Pacebacteria bacterium]|nr:MAG: hypothetical protein UX00_C0003G0107 [Microgenomates group bacterium GW2011_GWB1_45_17]KKU22938.1 MAG: hypothetical protein UX35_C0013G0015 [Microgenomates group bacterium GW2011_GWA1_46_15]KKU24089.1 MAG: hypothetical protein UX36_C0002G0072 [Microgenomates group bacterium GW2011_GWC1_46_15]HAV14822.1 hypothetical protein [Candidatus Paceibacterota bacterium]HCR11213.1 hypothetical protein [Candidatus Paceibacterota bacterium]